MTTFKHHWAFNVVSISIETIKRPLLTLWKHGKLVQYKGQRIIPCKYIG